MVDRGPPSDEAERRRERGGSFEHNARPFGRTSLIESINAASRCGTRVDPESQRRYYLRRKHGTSGRNWPPSRRAPIGAPLTRGPVPRTAAGRRPRIRPGNWVCFTSSRGLYAAGLRRALPNSDHRCGHRASRGVEWLKYYRGRDLREALTPSTGVRMPSALLWPSWRLVAGGMRGHRPPPAPRPARSR